MSELEVDSIRKKVITIVGPRESGKSYLTKQLLLRFSTEFDHIYICCPSLQYNSDYEIFMKGITEQRLIQNGDSKYMEQVTDDVRDKFEFLSREVEFDRIGTIVKEQSEAVLMVTESSRYKDRENVLKLRPPETLLVFDDCLDSSIIKSPQMINLIATRGRHIHISMILISQHLNKVPKSVRINSDYFILFPTFSVSELEQFLEQFTTRATKKEIFRHVNEVYDEDYKFIIMKPTAKDMLERLFSANCDTFIEGNAELINIKELIYGE